MSKAGVIEHDVALPQEWQSSDKVSSARSDLRGSMLPIVSTTITPSSRELSSRAQLLIPACIEVDEDGVYTGYIPSLAGCVSEGDTFKEAKESLTVAVRDIIALHRERGTSAMFREPEEEFATASSTMLVLDVPAT